MGRVYSECGSCREIYHVDDSKWVYCEECQSLVCTQCVTVTDDGDITKCGNCEAEHLYNTQKEHALARLKSIPDMVTLPHKQHVQLIINDIIAFVERR